MQDALSSEIYVEVRRRVFRQLIESLLYEGLLGAPIHSPRTFCPLVIEGRDDGNELVTYEVSAKRHFSFNRISLGLAPVIRRTRHTAAEAESVTQFLKEVQPALGADPQRLIGFAHELEQTVLKDALAQSHRRQLVGSLHDSDYDEMEALVMDGHLYHPSYKSRIGFDCCDHANYGPEFRPILDPMWLAVDRRYSRLAVSERLELDLFIKQELGAAYPQFVSNLPAGSHFPGDYLFVPVHPWQWRERVLPLFHDELMGGRLIPLGSSGEHFQPQQSLRTLSNRSAPNKCALKLPLSILNTSTLRILAPHTVRNAPLITDWLQRLHAEDDVFSRFAPCGLLGEVLGLVYEGPPQRRDELTYGILGCIWRESVSRHLTPPQRAVPFTALCTLDLSGEPFIQLWLSRYGVERWLEQLLRVSITPAIHFLYGHGIALEAHAQNMILIHEHGHPVKVVFRDFHDGVRFCSRLLAQPERRPAVCPTPPDHARVNGNSYIETDSAEEVRDFLADSLFFINLSQLAIFLADRFGYPEEQFWELARGVIQAYHAHVGQKSHRLIEFNLLDSRLSVEQLTARRLFSETVARVHAAPNPLCSH
jgi:2-[(L-alanin-3-ylcarbamoyl)methyl]-3-(2-aminoethylcarbamoyl)-2-hydroxypropanoate synthase